ncbi:HupE/UreJ family protein [Shewanella vesiculosa]|uniref:HupE/UreJ family protein n=1 Tax=Shewanella vesiculosa TaxID=518738 RepID=A0ABV0FMF9_9GAMM
MKALTGFFSMIKGGLLLLLLLFSHVSFGHQMSTSYLAVNLDKQGQVDGTWQVRLFDINQIVSIDDNQDGQLTWAELQAHQVAVMDYLRASLMISRQQDCPLSFNPIQQIDQHFSEGYLVSSFNAACDSSGPLSINYNAFFNIDSDHKAITTIITSDHQYARVISNDNRIILINLGESQVSDTFAEYVYQGIIHIWKGTDHVLFLLALLLTCVLVREQRKWNPIDNPKQIFKDTAWIITAFTLAHSVTLTATALGILNFSSHWVELGIALSVLFAALNNVWPIVLRLGWITFAFGLLHGMGFAGVLGELGLPENQKLLAILAFNVGVEIGQLAILALVLPLLIFLRHTNWYRNWGMQLGSIAIGLMAIQWSVERF